MQKRLTLYAVLVSIIVVGIYSQMSNSAVTLRYMSKMPTDETLTISGAAAETTTITVVNNGYDTEASYNADTTVPVTEAAYFSQALSGGSATIDLTSLTGANGVSIDLTGLKVQSAKFRNPVGNSAITITFGAADPYLLGGVAFKWILLEGQEIMFFGNDGAPDVASGAKDIDLSGTGVEELEVSLVAG